MRVWALHWSEQCHRCDGPQLHGLFYTDQAAKVSAQEEAAGPLVWKWADDEQAWYAQAADGVFTLDMWDVEE